MSSADFANDKEMIIKIVVQDNPRNIAQADRKLRWALDGPCVFEDLGGVGGLGRERTGIGQATRRVMFVLFHLGRMNKVRGIF